MGLEKLVEKLTRNMVVSDIHIPYQDHKAVDLSLQYAKKYKPDNLVINGDLLDFYSLSFFDKNPARKTSIQEECDEGFKLLKQYRQAVGNKCKIYLTEGNHEARLQKYLFKNPELESLRALRLPELLRLKELNIQYRGVSFDYWKDSKTEVGMVELGDTIVAHGDNRLNGFSASKYAGYSAKNSMMNGAQKSVVMGHVHRLAIVHHSTPFGTLTGVEEGCLCMPTGTANWQQGFLTFETHKGKNVNYRLHSIKEGKMYEPEGVYNSNVKK